MARTKKRKCEICANDMRPIRECQRCKALLCPIGFDPEEVEAALIKARKGHRKIKITCWKCKAKGVKDANTQ